MIDASQEPLTLWHRCVGMSLLQVVEELLSKSGAIGLEAAKAIADAAMLEVASINVPHMVK